jgi:hypothetical protein
MRRDQLPRYLRPEFATNSGYPARQPVFTAARSRPHGTHSVHTVFTAGAESGLRHGGSAARRRRYGTEHGRASHDRPGSRAADLGHDVTVSREMLVQMDEAATSGEHWKILITSA